MKRLLTILLSMLIAFSSCLMVAADEDELIVNATQNGNGDLVVDIQGADANDFINAVTNKNGYTYIALCVGNYDGHVRGDVVRVGEGYVTISKEDLIKGGFVSGEYTVRCTAPSNGRIFETKVTLSLDNTVTPDQLQTLKLNQTVETPIIGDTISYDDSYVNIVDGNGNAVSRVFARWTKTEPYCSLLNEDGSCKEYSEYYRPGEEDTFKEGETYYYTVDYYYTMPMNEKITTSLIADGLEFTNIGIKASKGVTGIPDCELTTWGFQSFVATFTPKQGSVEVKETASNGVGEEIASNVKIENSVSDVQNLVEVTEKEQKAIDEGKKLEVQMVVSSQSAVMENHKDDVAKVEATVSDKGLVKGAIYDISIYKNIEGETEKTAVTKTNSETVISFPLEDRLVNKDSSVNREYKVVRVHDGETTVLDATYDSNTKSITFKTDKFSTYAICYKDTKKEEKKEETNTSSNTSSTKVVTCEEAMNSKDWTWSESKKACVYRVTNTSAK